MKIVEAYLGLGCNLGECEANLCSALQQINELTSVTVNSISSFYRSKPLDNMPQADYLNAVVQIETGLLPIPLLDKLQAIEYQHGRRRHQERWGPRSLDIDILLYGDQVINHSRLRIPHPGISQRDFVLIPLVEINPQIRIPGLGKISEVVALCPDRGLSKLPTPCMSKKHR
ncbi:MAG: 2-amino-4-hydroxy-6-hydroxymethyldihydropteridine diphosphokinase [Gammaproteobacteria bacterium]|nr:2-amino-4-hydroxy-6-hydroxymethyldihydropteridine diphosphokinase [Gammaproteobacteria bacterium]